MAKSYNTIGKWLLPKLESLDLSVEEFGRRAKVKRASLYQYISDSHRPETQAMVRICRALGVPLEEGLSQYTPHKRGRPAMGAMAKRRAAKR